MTVDFLLGALAGASVGFALALLLTRPRRVERMSLPTRPDVWDSYQAEVIRRRAEGRRVLEASLSRRHG